MICACFNERKIYIFSFMPAIRLQNYKNYFVYVSNLWLSAAIYLFFNYRYSACHSVVILTDIDKNRLFCFKWNYSEPFGILLVGMAMRLHFDPV